MAHDREQSQSNLGTPHEDLGLCDMWGGVVLSGLGGRVKKKGNFRKELKETGLKKKEGKGSLGKEGLVPNFLAQGTWKTVFHGQRVGDGFRMTQIHYIYWALWGLPWWPSGKECTSNAGAVGNMGLIRGSERSPEGGKYSCLETPMDRGAW